MSNWEISKVNRKSKMKKAPIKTKWMATQNQRYLAYQRTPELLAEDLLVIFSPIAIGAEKGVGAKMSYTEAVLEGSGKHKRILEKLYEYCPDIEQMLINVAKAINKTAKSCRDI